MRTPYLSGMSRPRPLAHRNYGSIPHLQGSKLGAHDKFLHEGQDAIVRRGGRDRHDRVYASLKLDGTNVGVFKQDGRLLALQRKGYDCASSPYRMHHEFDAFVHERYARFDALLAEGERVVGEWLWQASGIHYVLRGEPFLAFDLFTPENERLPWERIVERVEGAGFWVPAWRPVATLTGEGAEAALLSALSAEFDAVRPVEPAVRHEGIVVRVERKGRVDFMGKWVRSDFEPGVYLPGLQEDSPRTELLNLVA